MYICTYMYEYMHAYMFCQCIYIYICVCVCVGRKGMYISMYGCMHVLCMYITIHQ